LLHAVYEMSFDKLAATPASNDSVLLAVAHRDLIRHFSTGTKDPIDSRAFIELAGI
jgi:hypothetical protein